MDILTIKQASSMWGISVRRIAVLCNEGRINGLQKNSTARLKANDVTSQLLGFWSNF